MDQPYNLEDIVSINTKCTKCGLEGEIPTFKQILDKKDSPLSLMLEEKGYADVECATECQ